jgi:predicted DNA-binding transcriptional regulator AlpA
MATITRRSRPAPPTSRPVGNKAPAAQSERFEVNSDRETFLAEFRRRVIQISDLSEITGLPPRTISVYLSREGAIPEPIGRFGKSPVWLREDIEAWNANRTKRKA